MKRMHEPDAANSPQREAYRKYKGLAKTALGSCPPKGETQAGVLLKVLRRDLRCIEQARKTAQNLEKRSVRLPEAFEWVADNYYLYEEKALALFRALKGKVRLQGSAPRGKDASGRLIPRFYAAFSAYLDLVDEEINDSAVEAFIAACDRCTDKRPGFADYYSFEMLFSLAVISKTAALCASLCADPYAHAEAETARELGRCVLSLKYIGQHRFEKSFEGCETEELLLQDPAGFYPIMSKETKDYYRRRVMRLAARCGIREADFVRGILEKARAVPQGRFRHIGAYLYPEKPKGAGAAYFTVLAVLTGTVCVPLFGVTPFAFVLVFPVWEAAKQITDRLFSHFVKTPPVPRLALEHIPDTDGVLVVITTLLFGGRADDAIFSKLEKLYLSNGMNNVFFAVLGDYADSPHAEDRADEAILADAVTRTEALRAKYGDCFALFLRARHYSKTQRAFLGYERKRGAVMQLVRYLCGGENVFLHHSAELAPGARDRLRYVITLDADTNLAVDAVRDLAGAMLHPLNRPAIDPKRNIVTSGYGVMQPRVAPELAAARETAFARVMCGTGGIETYAFTQFDLYQSVFGEAVFCGKGIFDKYAFDAVINAPQSAFPEDSVLSHDILEGARLRTALVSDLEVTDGFPKNELSYFKRHHRWVRGDVQNLAYLGSRCSDRGERRKNGITALSKFKLFDNVRREAVPVLSFFALLAASFLPPRAASPVIFFALLPLLLPFVFDCVTFVGSLGFQCAARRFFSKGVTAGIWQSLMRTLLGIAMLPKNALTTLDAMLRASWRMTVTRKNMLEWVTAAQSDAASDGGILVYVQKNLVGALLGVPLFLLSPYGALKLIGLLWFFLPAAAYACSRPKEADTPQTSDAQKQQLKAYAGDMWRFFENTVGAEDNFLPIDNLQLFPAEMRAHRTSPTNIGLYLLCVLAARDFGFIDTAQLYARLDNTLAAVERMEKWQGHLYNWYDTTTLHVLFPRYVSGVDSGNFLACLITVAQGVKQYACEKAELVGISARAEALFDATDLDAVYDRDRQLFAIGVSFENGAPRKSENCYDMLMSEARTLSFLALAKRSVGKKHWARLSRPLVKHRQRVGLASWTGTAFEYFMPALFLPTVKGSLMYEALRFAFYCQRRRVAGNARAPHLWGISESGYFAFDSEMNYRYRAFGIPTLGFKRGLENDLVLSPYSSFLALCLNTTLPLANLRHFAAAGAYGKYGFYEAYDFTAGRGGENGALVKSYMAHHVGMSLAACANACMDQIMVRRFMSDARMRSVGELLEEKIPVNAVVRRARRYHDEPERPERRERRRRVRIAFSDVEKPFCRVLSDGFAGAAATDAGFVRLYAGKNALNVNERGKYDLRQGFFTFLEYGGQAYSPAYLPLERKDGSYHFEYSGAGFAHRFEKGAFTAKCSYTVRSEHSVLAVRLEAREVRGESAAKGADAAKTAAKGAKSLAAAFCFEPLLMPEARYEAHPAFHSLFVTSAFDSEQKCLIYERRARSDEAPVYLAVGFADARDNFAFATRKQDVLRTPFRASDYADVFRFALDGEVGVCLSPLCLIRTDIELSREGLGGCTLLLACADSRSEAIGKLVDARKENAAQAAEKAENLEALMLLDAGLMPDAATVRTLSELTRCVLYPTRCEPGTDNTRPTGKHCLWECGISGDLPIVLVEVPSAKAAGQAQMYIRAFLLLRKKKLPMDLVLLTADSEKYRRPRENAVLAAIEHSGATEYLKKSGGGLFVVDPQTLSDEGRALYAFAAGVFGSGKEQESTAPTTPEPCEIVTAPEPIPERDCTAHREAVLESGSGYFDAAWNYTVEKAGDNAPTLPQSMVLAGRMMGSVLTHNSLGYTFAGNAAMKRLTPFHNDPTGDMRGERLFCKDGETWYDLIAMAHRVTYGAGVATYAGTVQGVPYRVRVYIPEKLPMKVIDVQAAFAERTELVFAVCPIMGEREREKYLCERKVCENRAEFVNPYAEYFSGYTGFVSAVPGGAYEFPSCGMFADYALCRVTCEQEQTRFALGAYRTASGMGAFCLDALAASGDALYESAAAYAERMLPEIRLHCGKTSDVRASACAAMFNRWLPYQNNLCRMTARSGFYQSGGAYGFRDQLQDALMLMYADRRAAKAHILRAAAHQFEQGDALHWWHPKAPRSVTPIAQEAYDRGIRSNCSDDYLWLVYAVCTYIGYTGDRALLDIPVRYAAGEELREGESERYIETRRSELSESVFEHCMRALERAYGRLGGKGLALLGSGDWSDGLNRAGEKLRGESVWLSMFLKIVTERFAALCGTLGRTETANALERRARTLENAIRRNGFSPRAGYFARAWYDDGTPIGLPGGAECAIDLLPQAFSVAAGLPRDMAESAVRKAYELLYDAEAKIFRLLWEPFGSGTRDPGYIKGYAPGIRENGGQYTHAAVWGVMAMIETACRGETPDRELLAAGTEALLWLLPPLRCADRARNDIYRCEPYVLCGDVYASSLAGRGGWSWYTGSAGWLWRAMLGVLYGVSVTLNGEEKGVRLDFRKSAFYAPFALAEPPTLELSFKEQGVNCTVSFERQSGGEKLLLDGNVSGKTLFLSPGKHHIRVLGGENGSPSASLTP